MTRNTAPHAIGKVFKGAIGHMAAQAWLVGHLDASRALIETVLEEARENEANHPRDIDCKEAVRRLSGALHEINAVSRRLSQIAVGDKADG